MLWQKRNTNYYIIYYAALAKLNFATPLAPYLAGLLFYLTRTMLLSKVKRASNIVRAFAVLETSVKHIITHCVLLKHGELYTTLICKGKRVMWQCDAALCGAWECKIYGCSIK
jgi:hypothetical protein